jgi:ABC-type Mn2+/Zn2+ transport system permease subunit
MSAVVPAFAALLRGSRPYLMASSALGLVAFIAGLWAAWANEPIGLAVLVMATLVLWAMSTWRHVENASARAA